jgi:peptidoglycan hydrolase-like protein with peptidoglycan-binding domain
MEIWNVTNRNDVMAIFGSVGRGGKNEFNDVRAVQRLLTAKGIATGQIDGKCGPRTIAAIWKFQAMFMRQPDGRVDPDGLTLRRLLASPIVSPVEIITKSVGSRKEPYVADVNSRRRERRAIRSFQCLYETEVW